MGRGRKGKAGSVDGTGRRGRRDRLTLHSAALGSPMFQESWSVGSPLDWSEFVRRWEFRHQPAVSGGAAKKDT